MKRSRSQDGVKNLDDIPSRPRGRVLQEPPPPQKFVVMVGFYDYDDDWFDETQRGRHTL